MEITHADLIINAAVLAIAFIILLFNSKRKFFSAILSLTACAIMLAYIFTPNHLSSPISHLSSRAEKSNMIHYLEEKFWLLDRPELK